MMVVRCMRWRVQLASALVLALVCVSASRAFAVSPRQLLEVADIDQPTISPDGRFVAFRVERASVARNTYDTVWYVQGPDDSVPTRVAEGGVPLRDSAGESLPATVAWSKDNRWIYYRALIDGKIGVWRAAADGSGAEPVTHDAADVRDFALDGGGRALRYSVGATRQAVRSAEQSEYDQGIHIDSTVPIGQGLFRSGYVGGSMATQRFSKVWFDRMPLLGDVPDRWKALDLHTGVTRELDGAGGGAVDDDAALKKRYPDVWVFSRSPTSGRVALLTRFGKRNGERFKPDVRLSVLSGRGAQDTVCKAALCTGAPITGVQWRPHSDEVLFTVTDPAEGLAQSIYRWNVSSGEVLAVAQSAGLLSGGRKSSSACGVSFATMVCVSATANQPPRLEQIDLATGTRKVLFEPNAALAQTVAESGQARFLRWKDANGQVFTGQFYAAKSRSRTKPPLFVDYYRCTGFVRGGMGDEWPFATLAAQGISALCINAGPYRIKPADRYNEALTAVESAVKLLSARGEIDATKVGMGGLSFGTEVTMWVAMNSRLLSAASITSPLISSTYYLFGSLQGAKFEDGLKELWGLGSPEQTPERWRQVSPALNLEKISAPILIQTPEQEYLYGLDYEIPLIRQHRADLYVFPNEPHMKFQPKHKLAAYERNLDWFRFWLQGYEDPAPSKKAQYARWRAMRESSR
ncbi:Atxe2 family lasso peptide isopeptidase [Rhodanobacter umsongensis]|uniref:Atxe2 family lasso peptide isopeptidase n=1 Tax=Rhodanobacter umsongensis TaxID=633153 RepID=A0ABW0JN20_9GAMM